ncbi:MAG TPA: glycosyltransferase family 87 protein [Anaeromyxobacteraceae bacterium]|nr:glycosyltransferase family 87 protein [Anaeromyxobacteraceae bacterium]
MTTPTPPRAVTACGAPEPPATRIAAAVVLALLAIGYGLVCVRGNDFQTFREVGRFALDRADVYANTPSTGMRVYYAPPFALLLAPFALLPWKVSAFLWYALKLAALAWLARLLWREVRPRVPDRPWERAAYLALPFAAVLNPLNVEFKLGQVNLFVFAFVLLAVRMLRRGSPWAAALCFSLALVKVTPWVFLPWLALRRQWGFLVRLAAVALGWVAALAVWFGPGRVAGLFLGWFRASGDKLGLEHVAYFENQSLAGVVARLALAWPPLQADVLGMPLWRLLPAAATAALLAAVAGAVARDRFRRRLPEAEFAFLCAVMLLASPDSRWAHLVTLLGPFMLLAVLAADLRVLRPAPRRDGDAGGATVAGASDRARARLSRAIVAVTALALVAFELLSRDVVGKGAERAIRASGLHTAVLAAVAALTGVLMYARSAGLAGADASGAPAADATPP